MFPAGWWESLLWRSDGYQYNNSSTTLESITEEALKQTSSSIACRRMSMSIWSHPMWLFLKSNLGHLDNFLPIGKMISFTNYNLYARFCLTCSQVLYTRSSRPNVWRTWHDIVLLETTKLEKLCFSYSFIIYAWF